MIGYARGSHDRKDAFGDGMKLNDFMAHDYSRAADLKPPHVLGLRLYTTAAFRSLVNPLRDSGRTSAHPFPHTIHFINEAVRKLRAVDIKKVRGALLMV
jgi:hypothetical protein